MSIPSFSLADKIAIVTGGKRGIGKAIALAFAEAGADVAICGRAIEGSELEAVTEEIRQLGRRSLAIQADIAQKTDVDNMVQRVITELGSVDILVNNAVVRARVPLLELEEDVWDWVIDTDLKGYYLCCQAAGRKMVDQKRGNIINMVSVAATRAVKNLGAYCIAKAGVVMLTKMLALELASDNIRVNGIAPSMVGTESFLSAWSSPGALKKLEAEIPLGRLAEPDEILGAALFLASDASSFVTGQTIFVDGGWLV